MTQGSYGRPTPWIPAPAGICFEIKIDNLANSDKRGTYGFKRKSLLQSTPLYGWTVVGCKIAYWQEVGQRPEIRVGMG